MTVKEIILALICVLLAYLCWLCVQFLLSLRQKRPSLSQIPAEFEPADGPSETIQSRIIGGGQGKSFSSDVYRGVAGVLDDEEEDIKPIRLEASERRYPPPPEPDASSFGFDALLEMRQTRHLVDDMQRQINALTTELDVLRKEMANLRSSSRVSSYYGDAVELAQRGYDAQAIAERCGISVAEAEMVRALSADNKPTEG